MAITSLIYAGTSLSITLPASTAHILVPPGGLAASSPLLRFATTQPYGSVIDTPIRRAPGIYAADAGTFTATRLDLTRPSRSAVLKPNVGTPCTTRAPYEGS